MEPFSKAELEAFKIWSTPATYNAIETFNIGFQNQEFMPVIKCILSDLSPRIAVIQDPDQPPCVGSPWAEMNGNIHCALGRVGLVSNSGFMDLAEVYDNGFRFFTSYVIPSHAYVHMGNSGRLAKVGVLAVNNGDFIHADRLGGLL